jgi:hypothetical protein
MNLDTGRTESYEEKKARVRRLLANMRRNKTRRERDQVMRDLGLVKVRGECGGTYWE